MIFSNPLAYASAYSVQTYHLCKVLLLLGHELFLIDCALPKSNGQQVFNVQQLYKMYEGQHPEFCDNFKERWDVCSKVTFVRYMYQTFPCELYVKDFNELIDELKIDFMLFFIDIWIIKTDDKVKFNCPAITWLPIHFQPVEERTIQAAELFDKIVTLSTDGAKKLKELFPKKEIMPCPHILDFEHYKLGDVDRNVLRDEFGIPRDKYVVLMVMNNSESTNRKGFCANFNAFKQFHESHPDAFLYIHSKIDGSLDLRIMLDYFEMPKDSYKHSDSTKMTKGGFTFDKLVRLYKASDVLLSATCSEGFGIPVVEAQALGIPVIGTDTTAFPDNVYNGELAKVYDYRFCYQNTSYWATPDVQSIVECLEKIHDRTPEESKRLSRLGMAKTRENYNLKTLYDNWSKILPRVSKPIKG